MEIIATAELIVGKTKLRFHPVRFFTLLAILAVAEIALMAMLFNRFL